MDLSRDRLQFSSLYTMRFAGSFGFMTVMTLLPDYIDALGATGITIGVFVTALELARTVGIVPIAWAGDRYSKRTALLAGLVTSVLAYAAFAVITSIEGFLGARLLQGLGMTGVGLLGLAVVGDLAPASDRANYIGKYNAFRMAGGGLAPLAAGGLFALTGFSTVFVLVAVIMGIATVGVYVFVEDDQTSIEGFAFADLAVNRRILTMATFRVQYAVAVTLVRKWVPIFVGVSAAKGGLAYGSLVVGAVLAAEQFANMLGQPYTGRLADRFGRAPFVIVGGSAYGVIAMAFPFISGAEGLFTIGVPIAGEITGTVLAAIVLNGLLGAADAFREPASMALFADEGKGEGIASSIGIRSLLWKPGSILAPLLGGWLMGAVGIEWVFFLGGVAALTGVGSFLAALTYQYGCGAFAPW
ncbi:MFS transporter [Halorhabdus sp. CUG00001]|uniref:MFS transporter n=1 Tax=Halorhabdus sp. CUG00001 TaxID=2600297 RepID=UPI00131B6AC2|nr:MFS transporter [Halorhabdus sp. CUG00001]